MVGSRKLSLATDRKRAEGATKPNNPGRGKPYIGGLLQPGITEEHGQCPATCNIVRLRAPPPPCNHCAHCIHGAHCAHGGKPRKAGCSRPTSFSAVNAVQLSVQPEVLEKLGHSG